MGRGRPRDGSPASRSGFRGAQQRSAAGTSSGALTLLTGHRPSPSHRSRLRTCADFGPLGTLNLMPWEAARARGDAFQTPRVSTAAPALERLPLARDPPWQLRSGAGATRRTPWGHHTPERVGVMPSLALAGEVTAREPREPRPPPRDRQGAHWKNAMGFW